MLIINGIIEQKYIHSQLSDGKVTYSESSGVPRQSRVGRHFHCIDGIKLSFSVV